MPPAWRPLAAFWTTLLLLVAAGAGTLQWLGPPPPSSGPAPPAPKAAAPAPRPVTIAAPDPALSEPSARFPGRFLPRTGADGRTPMAAYAHPFDPGDKRPRVAILVAGLGLSTQASLAAIRTLPGAVTLAFSPYGDDPTPLLAAARASGHEFLLSIPMEPLGWPLDDPGPHALMANADPAQNQENLEWALTRMQGYAGVTGALGMMLGERFAGSGAPFDSMLHEIARRGLFYVDPRTGRPPPAGAPGRGVDLVLDAGPEAAQVAARLSDLEAIARIQGTALGLVETPDPAVVARIAAWAEGLAQRGAVLAPASALLGPAPKPAPVTSPQTSPETTSKDPG